MANKLIAKSKLSLQVEESNKVLPDESDQIVVDLKEQLAQLKEQLLRYEEAEAEHGSISKVHAAAPEEVSENLPIQLQIKKHHIASMLEREKAAQHRLKILPHVVDNLQKPISQMTADLEQLIASVHDSEVQNTLTQCLSVVENVSQLTEHTKQLDQALHPQKNRVDLLAFFRKIAREQNQGDDQIKLYASGQLPQSLYIDEELFKKSILILLQEISRLSDDDIISIKLRQGDEMIYDVSVEHLKVSLFGGSGWNLPEHAEMEEFLAQSLESSDEWGLDVLYAQKVMEAHGGSLALHREEDDVVGFDITLPVNEK
ncbi:MAG: hypothetical protein HQM13_20255 [SAR324 cluster bacterium]|nr:hypothetical protein [SAR324 cluster bacterium]